MTEILSPGHSSLALGVPPAAPGTIYALAIAGGIANQLTQLQPDANWTTKRVEHLVVKVRTRLSKGGVAGLTREEMDEPIGNSLNHNLIRELMSSTTLVPPDLRLLNYADD